MEAEQRRKEYEFSKKLEELKNENRDFGQQRRHSNGSEFDRLQLMNQQLQIRLENEQQEARRRASEQQQMF